MDVGGRLSVCNPWDRTEPHFAAGSQAASARAEPLWHILQMSDVLDLEFATGLAEGER